MNQTQSYHFIGLDIHKNSVTFCELNQLGRTVDHGTLTARKQDLMAFALSRRCGFVAGLEATMFTGWVYDVLTPYAAELYVGHPRRLKALTKNKNDRVDARMLAKLLRADMFPSCYMASAKVRELRRVLRHRNFLVHEATRMKNRAATILMEAGVAYTKSKLHGKRYFSELLDTLEEVPASVVELLRMTRTNLEMFTAAQRTLLGALTQHTALRERVELLKTVGGVGDVTALTWALEIDNPHRFSNVKRAQSYCGLSSAQHESAGKQWHLPLSKERNPYLQTALIEAAKLGAFRYDYLARIRERALDKGNKKNEATLDVARKLVAYLLAVDKSGTPFVTPET